MDILLTLLTMKNRPFIWYARCEQPYVKLKKLLTGASVLLITDVSKPFIVYFDSCGMGLGALLMQECRVVAHASKHFKPHDKTT